MNAREEVSSQRADFFGLLQDGGLQVQAYAKPPVTLQLLGAKSAYPIGVHNWSAAWKSENLQRFGALLLMIIALMKNGGEFVDRAFRRLGLQWGACSGIGRSLAIRQGLHRFGG